MSTGSWTVPGSLTVNNTLTVSGAGITAGKVVPWTTLPGATAYTSGSSNQTPQYCVDELGYVRLRGIMVPQATMFTLPTGARPPNNFYKAITGLTSTTLTTGQLAIAPTGVATSTGAGTTWVSLDDTIFATS